MQSSSYLQTEIGSFPEINHSKKTEIEDYDAQVGSLLTAVDASGRAKNTLLIITSDHGMPFPRVKGHTFDDANHIPLVACWPEGIVRPGRRVADFINFIDLAPSFLELFPVDGKAAGMSPITGRSFTDLLHDNPTTQRPFKTQNDPRVFDRGAVFDEYRSPRALPAADQAKKNSKK